MKSISLYEDKHSFLNRLLPESKLLYVLAAIIIPVFVNVPFLGVAFIVISSILLLQSGVFRKTFSIMGISSFVILTVLIIQGQFHAGNMTPVLQLGPAVFYKEGLLFALKIAINVLNIILSFCVLILTTKPSDLIENFVRRGFSPRFGYVFISLFQLIPQMTDKIATITDAQRSRGMETEGNILVRMKAFLPLISPVIMSSFIDTKERALALEVRGFNARNKKTFLNEKRTTVLDQIIQGVLVISIILPMIGRILQWLR
ncbi:energy-coupling factor transporter transmembrane component T [Clostridium sp. E02]|uniref:energy-coupling factor transporter transmembrane component T family protein n=1 Tax=Clostridium sp. E02 TaxID=2487134 RepID=UPI000F537F11|nr:energy-coupling factor transporter transmembrane component T [Clostridium sp. E02]